MADLNPRQREFARLYAVGPPSIRGNATAAYRAAGYQPRNDHVADSAGARLLGHVGVQYLIRQHHARADAETIAQLRDWKTMAPAAQNRLEMLSIGYLPDPDSPHPRKIRKIATHTDSSIARVIADAAKFIVNRAYPDQLYHNVSIRDPDQMLASILGVSADELPDMDSRFDLPLNGHCETGD